MAKMLGAIWSVQWCLGHKEPPEGKPRVLIQVFRPEGHPEVRGARPPEEIRKTMEEVGLGSGYGLTWTPVCQPPKEQRPEILANVRRKRLKRRIEKKFPLFVEQFYEEEIAKKPDYYDGITDARIADARRAGVKEESEHIANLIRDYEEQHDLV